MRSPLPGLIILTAGATAAPPAPGTLFYGNAHPEASAVVAVDERRVALVDNEVPAIALFDLDAQSVDPAAPSVKVTASPLYDADDVEAATVFRWDIDGDGKPEAVYHVFCASSSRTRGRGKVVDARDALFAVRIDATAMGEAMFPPAKEIEYNRTLRTQLRAMGSEHPDKPWGKALRDSVWRAGRRPDVDDPSLAGDDGLNIEALSVSKDGRALLLGLRGPLIDGKALLISITNPVAALGLGDSAPQPAALGAPVLLELGGMGLRSMEWDESRRVYVIAAGHAAGAAFFTWTGDAAAKPQLIDSPSAKVAGTLNPEGLTPVPGRSAILVVGDSAARVSQHRGTWIEWSDPK